MKNAFTLAATVTAVADISAGHDWSAVRLTGTSYDNSGVYQAPALQVGDYFIYDTSAFELGTVTLYTVTSIVSATASSFVVNVAYSPLNNNSAIPDLSFVVGLTGIFTRGSTNLGLAGTINTALQQVSESLNVTMLNINFERKLDVTVKAASKEVQGLAAAAFVASQLVRIDSSGNRVVASTDTVTNCSNIVGMAVANTASGGTVTYVASGDVATLPSPVLTPGVMYFLSDSGTLSTQPVSSASSVASVRVGVALTTTTLALDISVFFL